MERRRRSVIKSDDENDNDNSNIRKSSRVKAAISYKFDSDEEGEKIVNQVAKKRKTVNTSKEDHDCGRQSIDELLKSRNSIKENNGELHIEFNFTL